MKLLFVLLFIFNCIYLYKTQECPFEQVTHSASATYYEDINGGHCSFGDIMGPTGPGTLMIAALNNEFYDGASQCGQCFNIFSPYTNQSVVVVATDSCPTCSGNYHFDLSTYAFDVLGARSIGILKDLEFYKVPCEVKGNVKLMMKDGSNDNWTAFLIYNSNIGIKQVSVKLTGSDQYKDIELADYGYWVSPGMPVGPLEVRIESLGGEFIYLPIPKVESLKIYDTGSQFSSEGCIEATSSAFVELPSSSSKLLPSIVFMISSIIYLFI